MESDGVTVLELNRKAMHATFFVSCSLEGEQGIYGVVDLLNWGEKWRT